MRKLTTLMYFFMAAALFLTSCGGDDEDPEPEVQNPTFDFTASSQVKNGETITTTPGSTVTLIVTGSKADKNLKQVSFYEGNNLISDASRITVGGEAQTENPVDIKNADNDNFTWTITLKSSTDDNATNNYRVVLEDNDGLMAELKFSIATSSTSSDNVPKLYSQNGIGDAATIGSFYSTKNNTTYATTAAATNLSALDFALNEPTNGTYKLVRPQDQSTGNTTITSGNQQTVFSTTDLSFASVTSAQLSAASASATEIAITNGSTYFFYNSSTGVRALIKINSIDTANDFISFDVKYIVSTVALEAK